MALVLLVSLQVCAVCGTMEHIANATSNLGKTRERQSKAVDTYIYGKIFKLIGQRSRDQQEMSGTLVMCPDMHSGAFYVVH